MSARSEGGFRAWTAGIGSQARTALLCKSVSICVHLCLPSKALAAEGGFNSLNLVLSVLRLFAAIIPVASSVKSAQSVVKPDFLRRRLQPEVEVACGGKCAIMGGWPFVAGAGRSMPLTFACPAKHGGLHPVAPGCSPKLKRIFRRAGRPCQPGKDQWDGFRAGARETTPGGGCATQDREGFQNRGETRSDRPSQARSD
jgi:hypothetical protein